MYVAKLDAVERGLVVGLMEQVRELVEPAPVAESPEDGGDEFDRIVAGLGGIGMGISLAADDQRVKVSPLHRLVPSGPIASIPPRAAHGIG